MKKSIKFIPVDDEVLKDHWIFWNLSKLIKTSADSEVGRAVKTLITDSPDNVEGSSLSPQEFALYAAALFWIEQIKLRRM